MTRSYYSENLDEFLKQADNEILGILTRNHGFALDDNQKNAWLSQINILKQQLNSFRGGHLIFEYTIPRIGNRIDNVFLYKGLIFLLEFKVGDSSYHNYAIEQVMDYALDLKNFHKQSHNRKIIPILVATRARDSINMISSYEDGIFKPLKCTSNGIGNLISEVCKYYQDDNIVSTQWENSIYMPTPTIIEAAQALYREHSVEDISRSDAGAINLDTTTQTINKIIDKTKLKGEKST